MPDKGPRKTAYPPITLMKLFAVCAQVNHSRSWLSAVPYIDELPWVDAHPDGSDDESSSSHVDIPIPVN
jgi:hypothetical protein